MSKVHISINMKRASLPEIFNEIEHKTGFTFTYGEDVKAIKTKLRLSYKKASVAEILKKVTQKAGVEFLQINEAITVKGNQKRRMATIKTYTTHWTGSFRQYQWPVETI